MSSGRPFNITVDELNYLKSNNLPLPREYPDVRTLSRLSMLMRVERNKASCHFCHKDITSYYPPELGYKIVACEECYQAKIN